MILLKDIEKIYNSNNLQIKAVSNVNISFEDNKFYSILGPSGSGKSTLLRIISGLDKPTKGNVVVDDIDIYSLSDKELSNFRNKAIGFIFQSFCLEKSFTVLENVSLPLLVSGVSKKERVNIAFEVLKKLNLEAKAHQNVANLSGGECQMVSIARALVNKAKYIIADEPTGSLDSANAKIVLDELKKISKSGKTVILVTHNENDAKIYSDVIYRIKDGII